MGVSILEKIRSETVSMLRTDIEISTFVTVQLHQS